MQPDIVSIFKGPVNPSALLFVIAFDFERLRIDQNVFLNGGMRTKIFELPRSVGEFCRRGKDFHNKARGLDGLYYSPVAWITRYRYVGVEVARLSNVYLHNGTISSAVTPAQKVPENALDIGLNGVMIGRAASHGRDVAIDVLVACAGILFFELKVFFNRQRFADALLPWPSCISPSDCDVLLLMLFLVEQHYSITAPDIVGISVEPATLRYRERYFLLLSTSFCPLVVSVLDRKDCSTAVLRGRPFPVIPSCDCTIAKLPFSE